MPQDTLSPFWALAVAGICGLLLLVAGACSAPSPPEDRDQAAPSARSDSPAPAPDSKAVQPRQWAVALHAGGLSEGEDATDREVVIEGLIETAAELLDDGAAALDVVETIVTALEDDPQFNAGRGATFTRRGTHELDASIMDGRSGLAGAVAALRNIRNPVQLARIQLQRSSTVLVTADAAEVLSRSSRIPRAPQDYFTTRARLNQWQQDRRRRRGDEDQERTAFDHPSVGVVALDRYGNLAAAASSGGPSDRPAGALTAASVVGAAIWADNDEGAVAAWGEDGTLMRSLPAVRIADRLAGEGSRADTASAADLLPSAKTGGGMGFVALDTAGRVFTATRGARLLRGFADSTGSLSVSVTDSIPRPTPAGAATADP